MVLNLVAVTLVAVELGVDIKPNYSSGLRYESLNWKRFLTELSGFTFQQIKITVNPLNYQVLNI
ncbi:hypothetical protein SAMN06298216_2485 [Spirosomataceae bacterium TFI 002]|nr:hypothetical protein SAMN06298216_2485 [Spirosomataceae bacterium TFI 002]